MFNLMSLVLKLLKLAFPLRNTSWAMYASASKTSSAILYFLVRPKQGRRLVVIASFSFSAKSIADCVSKLERLNGIDGWISSGVDADFELWMRILRSWSVLEELLKGLKGLEELERIPIVYDSVFKAPSQLWISTSVMTPRMSLTKLMMLGVKGWLIALLSECIALRDVEDIASQSHCQLSPFRRNNKGNITNLVVLLDVGALGSNKAWSAFYP